MLLERKAQTVREFKEMAESEKHSHSPQSLRDDVMAKNYEAIEAASEVAPCITQQQSQQSQQSQ